MEPATRGFRATQPPPATSGALRRATRAADTRLIHDGEPEETPFLHGDVDDAPPDVLQRQVAAGRPPDRCPSRRPADAPARRGDLLAGRRQAVERRLLCESDGYEPRRGRHR